MLNATSKYKFPLKPFIANGIALWLLCAVLHEQQLFKFPIFKSKDDLVGFLFFFFVFYLVIAAFHAAIYFVLSLFPQILLFHLFKTKIKKQLWWWVIFLLPFVFFTSYHIYLTAPTVRAKSILEIANLAPLPESAQDIYVYTWSSPMSGEKYLRFQAEPDGIEQFINNSPILKDVEYDIYNKDKMRLYDPKIYPYNKYDPNSSHEYIVPRRSIPDWYREEIKGAGRRYEIQPEGYHYPGEVIIDYENNIVYVKLVFS